MQGRDFFGPPLLGSDLPPGQVLHVVNLVTAKSPPEGILPLGLLCSDPNRFLLKAQGPASLPGEALQMELINVNSEWDNLIDFTDAHGNCQSHTQEGDVIETGKTF